MPTDDQALIQALKNLTDKLDSVSDSVGRGSSSGTTKRSQVPGAKASSPDQKAQKENRVEIENNTKSLRAQRVVTDDEIKASKEAVAAQEDLTKEQKEARRAQEKTTEAFKGFGKSLVGENANLSSVFGGLSSSLEYTGTTFGRVAGGVAAGIGYALGGLQEFAKNAGDMGAFADLGKFSVGSVTQMKIMSGLGGAFMKVIEESEGTFRAFGANSQEAAENLSNLSRGLKYGSFYLNSTLKDTLGTDLVNSVERASTAAASMGMTEEERARLLGSLAKTASMGAKDEKDAQQRLVKQYSDTVVNTQKLSSAFGISSREILAAMDAFRKTTAGKFSSSKGDTGASNVSALIQNSGVTNDADLAARISKALAENNLGAAKGALSEAGGNASQQRILDEINRAIQGTNGGKNVDALNSNIKSMLPSLEALALEGDALAVNNADLANPLGKLLDFVNAAKNGDKDKNKEAPRTSETANIKALNSLTAALDFTRYAIISLTAILATIGTTFGAIAVAGTIGGTGILGKIADKLGSKLFGGAAAGPAADSLSGWKTGTTASAGSGVMDKLRSASGSAITDSASSGGSMGKTLQELGGGAGKGIKDLMIGIGKGAGKGIEALLRGLAAGIAAFANPAVLAGAAILSASIAVIGAGIAAATWLTGKALDSFGNSLKVFNDINGGNLAAIGGGLAAMGAGAVVFAAGMVAATATSLVTGLMSLFGAKSPIERILELVPLADKISMIGEGMFKFGSGIGLINDNLRALDLDALANFKDALIEISNIDMPSLNGLSIPQISTDGITGTPQQGNALSNALSGNSAVTPEVISQLMSYLSSIGNDLAAIRGNTKQSGYESPVRLS